MTVSPTLSLCMIAKNEAVSLARCLASAQHLVAEMIVVDTGSSDQTVAIARQHGARVVHFTWCNDFSAARNASLAEAAGDWILVLDGDEYLDDSAAAQLGPLLQNPRVDGYQLVQRSLLPPGQIRRYSDLPITRLFRNRPEFRYQQPIHEQIQPAILRHGGQIHPTELLILHTGYNGSDPQREQKRAARNLAVLQTALANQPDDPYLVYHLGITHKALGHTAEAHTALARARTIDGGRLPADAREELLMKLAQLALAANDYASAVAHAADCLRLNPANVIARYVSALALLYQGEIGPAYRAFEQVRRAPDLDPTEIANVEAVLAWCREQIANSK